MESSIAVFLWRRPACERLPTKYYNSRWTIHKCGACFENAYVCVKRTVVISKPDASPRACGMLFRRLYSHRITCTVISAAYLRLFRHSFQSMKMNTPVHCLEGILSQRVDEQQMHWLTEWITNLLLLLRLSLHWNTHGASNARWSWQTLIHHLDPDSCCLCFNLRLQQFNILLLHWWRYILSLASEHTEISEMQFQQCTCVKRTVVICKCEAKC